MRSNNISRRGTLAVSALLAAVVVVGLSVVRAWPHMAEPSPMMPMGFAFDGWCCNGDGQTGDCQRIPDESVKPVAGGYQITLKPGDHRLVTKPHIFTKKQSEVRNAPDGRYYACLYPTEDILRCFYAPPPSY